MKFINMFFKNIYILIYSIILIECKRRTSLKNPNKRDEKHGFCIQGKAQSPINIRNRLKKTIAEDKTLEMKYSEIVGKLLFVGTTWRLSLGLEDQLKHELIYHDIHSGISRTYLLKQFQIHVPSEHQINGQNFDFEIHFVHELEDNPNNHQFDRLVIAILANSSDTSDPIFNDLALDGDSKISGFDKFVNSNNFYHYKGSLTTFPCTEDVNWIVLMNDGNKISGKMVNQAREFLKSKIGQDKNNRGIQEQQLRTIWQIGKTYRRVKLRRTNK